jgi:hypothetical protein
MIIEIRGWEIACTICLVARNGCFELLICRNIWCLLFGSKLILTTMNHEFLYEGECSTLSPKS